MLTQSTRDLMVCQDLLRKSTNHNVGWLVSDWLIVMASRRSHVQGGVIYLNEKVTQNQLADMLFMNRITCLKELHHLEGLGLIDLQGRYIGILDMGRPDRVQAAVSGAEARRSERWRLSIRKPRPRRA